MLVKSHMRSRCRTSLTGNDLGRTETALPKTMRQVDRRTQRRLQPKATNASLVGRVPQVVADPKNVVKGRKSVIYKFQKGQCDKGKKCPFKHVKDDTARTQSPRGNRTKSPSKGNKGDKGKKLSREGMAKTRTGKMQ